MFYYVSDFIFCIIVTFACSIDHLSAAFLIPSDEASLELSFSDFHLYRRINSAVTSSLYFYENDFLKDSFSSNWNTFTVPLP